VAKAKKKRPFDVETFLSTVDSGRTISNYQTKQKIYSQGDPADASAAREGNPAPGPDPEARERQLSRLPSVARRGPTAAILSFSMRMSATGG
jgi:hypothetical protein